MRVTGVMALTILASSSAAAAPALDRDAFVALVMAQGADARIAELEVDEALARERGAGLWPDPSLAWDREAFTSGGADRATLDYLRLIVPLVLSDRLGLQADAAGLDVAAARARRAAVLAGLRRKASIAFTSVIAARRRSEILRASAGSLGDLARVAGARESTGEGAGYDRLRIDVELGSVQDALLSASVSERAAEAHASRLLGTGDLPALSGELDAELPPPGTGPTRLEARADLEAERLASEALAEHARAASRAWVPDPTVNAGVQRLEQSGGYVVGVALPLPVFDRAQGESGSLKARAEAGRIRHGAMLRAARTQLDAANRASAVARERLERHRTEVLPRAEELRRSAEATFRLGRGGPADLLQMVDAERTAREARLALVDRVEEAHAAYLTLLLLEGALEGAPPGEP